jgi:hypothetical protein
MRVSPEVAERIGGEDCRAARAMMLHAVGGRGDMTPEVAVTLFMVVMACLLVTVSGWAWLR